MSIKLINMIKNAELREFRDDHLSSKERATLVVAFMMERPEIKLPENLDDAFVSILWDIP